MPSTETPKETTVVRCEMCPARKTANTTGQIHKGKWFCSYTCVQEYEEDMNDESPFWRDEPL